MKTLRLPCVLGLGCILFFYAIALFGDAPFTYAPITGTILSAQFEGNFAALVANETVFGYQVNSATLIGTDGHQVDLSDAFFGTQPWPDPPRINLGPVQTQITSVNIPAEFFPELMTGSVGYSFLFTATGNNGLFAMTSLALDIMTTDGEVFAFIGPNDGFGLDIPPDGDLPAPLPISIGIGVTGTGFDEALTSKSLTATPVPETGTWLLFAAGAGLLGWFRLAKYRRGLTLGILALACLTAEAAHAKRVVCISGTTNDPGDPYLSDGEGYERGLATGKDDVVRRNLHTPQEFKDCLSLLQNGDTLVIVAHSFEHGLGILWGGEDVDDQYSGFGSGTGELPVPDGFSSLMNIAIEMMDCYSDCPPVGVDSLCKKIKDASGGDKNKNTCKGYKGVVNSIGLPKPDPKQNTTREARQAGAECLQKDPSWASYPPVNSGIADNQLNRAQTIIDNCKDAKDDKGKPIHLVSISYAVQDTAKNCQQQRVYLSVGTVDICGDVYGGWVGTPSQCHAVGPLQPMLGVPSTIDATVQSLIDFPFQIGPVQSFRDAGFIPENSLGFDLNSPTMVGVPVQQVVFTTLVGRVLYLNGLVSPDGVSTTLVTGVLGTVQATLVPVQHGTVLIRITVPGTNLLAYSLFTLP